MANLDDLQDLLSDVYAEFGVAALYSAKGSAAPPVPVTLLPDTADGVAAIGGVSKVVLSRNVYRVRVAELAGAGVTPADGDRLILVDDAAGLRVMQPPVRKDPRRLEWTLSCEVVAA